MSDSHRNSLGIKSLPTSLEESLMTLKSDLNYLKVCFQMELIETYSGLKENEISEMGSDKSKIKQFVFYYNI
jgi:glutamine synthetase